MRNLVQTTVSPAAAESTSLRGARIIPGRGTALSPSATTRRASSAASSALPKVIRRPAEADLPAPLETESRTLFGKKCVRFDNPWAPGATQNSARELWKLLRTPNVGVYPSPEDVLRDLPQAEVETDAIAAHSRGNPMRVTWIGHASLLVQVDGLNFLTDPMFSERASASQMVGPKRFTPPAMAIEDLPRIDVVLLSHNHYDHLDTGSVKAIGDGPLWIVPTGLKGWMTRQGIDHCVELGWWEHVELPVPDPTGNNGGTIKVSSTPAQHWSSRNGFDRNTSLWCGYAVEGDGGERFFFAGDTAYCPVFPKIAERYGPFDIAAIPIGAHEPVWFMKSHHCSPQEALTIHKELGAKRSLAVHWGTFALAADLHADAPRQLVEACKERGIKSTEFSIIRHGESIVNDGSSRRYKCLFGGDDV